MGTDKLGDSAVRDPFETARFIDIADDTPEGMLIEVVVKELSPPNFDWNGKVPLFAVPANEPKSILDAKDAGECVACHVRVWLSPSSLKTMETQECVIFCLHCIVNKFTEVRGRTDGK